MGIVSDFVMDPSHPVPPRFPTNYGRDDVPPHVPRELIFETGVGYSKEFLADPYGFIARLHDSVPRVYYDVNAAWGNKWTFTRHEDCLHMLRSADVFRSLDSIPFPRPEDDWFYFIPQEIDPPHHRDYRNIVDPIFSPAGILTLRDSIQDRAIELIEGFRARGECEFTTDFGRPFPVSIFLDIMGLPQEMRDDFVSWGDQLIHDPEPARKFEALQNAINYLKQAIEEKRRQPDAKVMSTIIGASIRDRPLSEKEIFGFIQFLFIGGLDTVYAALNNIFLWLAQNPDRVDEIRSRPDDIDKIAEELLRRFSVVMNSPRVVARDVTIHGVELKEGDRVSAILPAASLDPAIFPDPLKVDFDRPRRTNLAFTVGVHSCMGGHLARMEVKSAIVEWIKRIPRFSLKPGTTIVYPEGGVFSPDKVPLVW